MKSQPVTHQRALGIPLQVFLLLPLQGGGETVQAACEHTAHSHVHTGPGSHTRIQIHLKNGGDPPGQILQNRQAGQLVNILPCKPGLHGKDFLLQPPIQGQVIRIGSQKSHGRMSVRILKPRHQKALAAVHLEVPGHLRKSFLLPGGHPGNPVILYPDLALENRTVLPPVSGILLSCVTVLCPGHVLHGQNSCIVKSGVHLMDSPPNPKGSSSSSRYSTKSSLLFATTTIKSAPPSSCITCLQIPQG